MHRCVTSQTESRSGTVQIPTLIRRHISSTCTCIHISYITQKMCSHAAGLFTSDRQYQITEMCPPDVVQEWCVKEC